jgi:hypothetical protein
MPLHCNSCGTDAAYGWRITVSKDGVHEECSECTNETISISKPDVYWKGPGFYPGIADSTTGKPIYCWSPRHKKQVMTQIGVREAGDMYKGQRGTEMETHDRNRLARKKSDKDEVLKASRALREHVRKPEVRKAARKALSRIQRVAPR